MTNNLLALIRCPVTREELQLEVIARGIKKYDGADKEIITEGILRSSECIYPILNGIPRLTVEAFLDYSDFLNKHVPEFEKRKKEIELKYKGLLKFVIKKNKRTKKSFSQEWNIFNYEKDKVWDLDASGMLDRFLRETDETQTSLKGKIIFDAGCGNGLLNQSIAACGATILGMDFSQSIERAFLKNDKENALFIQGDVQFPPVAFSFSDITHGSGVLIHTNNSELTFSCLEPCVKTGGKMSVWLYHYRKGFLHNTFKFARKFTSRLPLKFQYYLYYITIFPVSYVIKRLKGNKQNKREMMIDILDGFSPEYRWEHTHDEAEAWFTKRNYHTVKITTNELFGFNITGIKGSSGI
jgi:SAM-dependent methyltransferase/uncharacterized protein YbaR (Trm112 family)